MSRRAVALRGFAMVAVLMAYQTHASQPTADEEMRAFVDDSIMRGLEVYEISGACSGPASLRMSVQYIHVACGSPQTSSGLGGLPGLEAFEKNF